MITNRWTLSLCTMALLASTACTKGDDAKATEKAGSNTSAATMTEDDKTLYALGLMLGSNVKPLKLTPAELEVVKEGLDAGCTGSEPKVKLEEYGPKVQALAQKKLAAAAETEKADSKAYLESAAKEEGAEQLPSGLVMRTLTVGHGAQPKPDSVVKVHYEGRLTDGTVFDSSIKRGEPVTFPLNQVIPCWSEGVQHMKVGEKAKLVCPSEIAYGDQGRPPQIPGGATLVFEVQLLDIEPAAAHPGAAGK